MEIFWAGFATDGVATAIVVSGSAACEDLFLVAVFPTGLRCIVRRGTWRVRRAVGVVKAVTANYAPKMEEGKPKRCSQAAARVVDPHVGNLFFPYSLAHL